MSKQCIFSVHRDHHVQLCDLLASICPDTVYWSYSYGSVEYNATVSVIALDLADECLMIIKLSVPIIEIKIRYD